MVRVSTQVNGGPVNVCTVPRATADRLVAVYRKMTGRRRIEIQDWPDWPGRDACPSHE